MANNEINLTLKITESGDLKVIGKKAERAAAGLDKAGKSARTADRNLKGAAQASANGTKNFSKMAQGISGGIVPAYATLAAQIFAVSAAFNFLKDAGSLQLLQKGQVAYAAATGTSLRSLTKDIQRATEAQLGFRDAAQAAAIGTAAGLDPSQITDIAKAAKDASTVLGRDLTDSFNRLVRGITKAEPELLDELGIILRLDTATQKYADALGINADELTAFQRSQAVANDVLGQAEEKYGKVLEAVGGGANQFAQLSTAFEEIVNKIRNFAVEFLTPIATTLKEYPELIAVAFAPFAAQVLGTALPGLERLSNTLGQMAQTAEIKSKEAGESLKKNLKNDDRIKESKVLQGALRKEVEMNSKARLEDVKAHQGSLLLKLKNGEQLNNRQLRQIRENIKNQARGYTQLNATQKAAVHRTVNEVERANKLGATKIKGIWASTSVYVQTQLQNVGNTANSVFSRMVGFAQAAGAKIALALSAISWVTLIVSLGALALSFFRSGKQAEDSVPKYDYLKSKFEELTAETEKFIQVQNILNSEFENGNKAVEAFGKRLKTVSTGKLARDFGLGEQNLIGGGVFGRKLNPIEVELKRAREEANKTSESIKNLAKEYREAQNVAKEAEKSGRSDGGALGVSLGTVGAQASEVRALEELNDARENGIKTLRQYIDSKGKDLTSTQAGLGILLDEKQALQGLDNARFQQNKTVKEYLSSIEDLNDLENVNVQELLKRRDAVIALADQITNLTRLQVENDRLSSQFEQRLFPLNEYDRYIANLNQEIISSRELAATNGGFTDTEKERQKTQEARLKLVEEISTAETVAANNILRIETQLAKLSLGKTKIIKRDLSLQASILKNREKEELLSKKLSAAQTLINEDSLKYNEYLKIAKNERTAEQQALIDNQRARQRIIETSQAELELSQAKTAELIRQGDELARLEDTAFQALESNLEQQLAKIIKGEEKSLKDAVIAIAKGILNSIADTLANIITGKIMKAIFKIKTPAEDMKEKMEAANLDNQNKMRQVNADAARDMEAAIKRALPAPGTATPTSATTSPGMESDCVKLCPESTIPAKDPLGAHVEDSSLLYGNGTTDTQQGGGIFGGIGSFFGFGDDEKKEKDKTSRDENTGALSTLTETLGMNTQSLGMNILGLGLSIAAVTGNSAVTQILGTIMLGLQIIMVGLKIAEMFNATMTTANTAALITNTAALTASAGSSFLGFARYGMMPQGYSTGGIAKGPQAGYPTVLHGTEAVVPLPDGKTIPVTMQGGMGQQNNVTVNVAIDGNGNATQDQEGSGIDLGKAVAAAVQSELINQKRAGGILSPYGAS